MRRHHGPAALVAAAIVLGVPGVAAVQTGDDVPADADEETTVESPEPRTIPEPRPRPARWQMDASIRRVPDGSPEGIVVGPVTDRSSGRTLGEIAVRVHLDHAYAGDLTIFLRYDADRDGAADARVPVELYRARTDMAVAEQGAIRVRQGGTSYFHGDEVDPQADPFAALKGLPTGGDFSVEVIDAHPDDAGMIRGWGVLVGWDREHGYQAER